MRPIARIVVVAATLAALLGLPAAIGQPANALLLPLPGLSSGNVTYHGTIPFDAPGVGGQVVERDDLGARYFYVTGMKGLSIYDVTRPAAPVLVSFLPFLHSQNEDLKVSDDGTRAIIAADGTFAVSLFPLTTGIHVIDTTDPARPAIIGSSSPLVRGDGLGTGIAEHTAECATADCTVIYGRTGRIYTFDEASGIVAETGRWNIDRDGNVVGGIHALNRDETGLLISDSNPRLVLDPGVLDLDATPLQPRVLAQGARSAADGSLQHNNVRTDAADWTPRGNGRKHRVQTAVAGSDFDVDERSISVADERPVMRPGEMFLGNSETNNNPDCTNAGGLSTWSMVNFDRDDTTELIQLEVFQPLNGTWLDGNPAVNLMGCSGHWFTENDGVVAASWYEHGVRFFDIDKTVGTITEIGFFQPVFTEAGAAHWIDDDFVYSVDYMRGIDILRFDRHAPRPEQDEIDAAWIANLGVVGPNAAAERLFCSLPVG